MSTLFSIVGIQVVSRIRRTDGNILSPTLLHRRRCLCNQVIDTKVHHDAENKEFYLKRGNDKAVLKYKILSPKVVELEHTDVPDAFRGQGIAKILAEAALKYVVKKDLQMKITCEYLQGFVKKNPKPEYTKRMI